jgi:hypothetical protein
MGSNQKTFFFIGFITGFFISIWPIVHAYMQAPGMPGPYEATVQILFVGFFSILGGALGFVVGLVVDLLKRKRTA